jgi:hypothetical protein
MTPGQAVRAAGGADRVPAARTASRAASGPFRRIIRAIWVPSR